MGILDGLIDKKELLKVAEPEIMSKIEEVKADMADAQLGAINAFYRDYHPKIYQRSGHLVNVSTSVVKGTDKYSILFLYTGAGPNPQVFEGPFEEGYHGPPWGRGGRGHTAPQLAPSPWELIRDYAVGKYGASVME